MKRKIMVYCGEDGAAGKIEALARNTDETSFIAACGFQFDGQPEGDCALIMPDLPAWRRDLIAEAYNHKVEYVKAAQAPLRRDQYSLTCRTDIGNTECKVPIPPDLAEDIAAEQDHRRGPLLAAAEQASPKRKRGRPPKPKLTKEQIAASDMIAEKAVTSMAADEDLRQSIEMAKAL